MYQDVELNAELMPHGTVDQFLSELQKEERLWLERVCKKLQTADARCNALLWIRLPVRMSHLLQPLISNNAFEVHHATKDYIMLVKGPGERPALNVPLYGTHYVRVECVVLEKSTGKVLVVREASSASGRMKLVTGSVNSGEFIASAAEREVKEETNIDAQFVSMIGVGNRLRTRFGKDEVLVGCLLVSRTPSQVPVPRRGEILSAEWSDPMQAIRTCCVESRRWMACAVFVADNPIGRLEHHTIDDIRSSHQKMELYAYY